MIPTELGRVLLVAGGILVLLGLVALLAGRVPFIGRLPGDIVFRGRRFVFYFPLTTMLLVSAIVSFVLWLLTRR